MEASILQQRAVALNIAYLKSPDSYSHEDVENACTVLLRGLARLWREWPCSSKETVFTINVPIGCSVDTPIYSSPVLKDSYGPLFSIRDQHDDDDGDSVVSFKFNRLVFDPNPTPGTDRWIVTQGCASITALRARFYEPKSVRAVFPAFPMQS